MGQIPDKVLVEVGRQIVHRQAVGMGDITGDDFGTIFAKSVGGEHRSRPLGLADVVYNGCAWSLKTHKYAHPFRRKDVRLISGRNSPDYSLGIENPHSNPDATGHAVLAIWNSRVNQGKEEHQDLRIAVLLRNIEAGEFALFEEEARRFAPDDYRWSFNGKNNMEGRDKASGTHRFTWQPHGSQFTIIRDVPGSARQFSIIRQVPMIPLESILASVGYKPDWIKIHG